MLKEYQTQIRLFFSYIFVFVKAIFITLLLIFSFYHLAFSNRTLPGLYVSNISFSGLNKTQVEKKLDDIDEFTKVKWQLVIGGNAYVVEAKDLGYELNKDALVNQLFLLGREKNILTSFKTKLVSLTSGYNVEPIYNIDQAKYNKFVSTIIENVTSSYSDAKYVLSADGNLEIIPHQNGFTISEKKVKDTIDSKYLQLSKSTKITLSFDVIKPQITSEILVLTFDSISNFIEREFKIEYKNQSWTPSKQEKLEMITIANGIGINFDQPLLKQVVDFVNNPKTVEVFEVENGKVTKFVPANDGVLVDQDLFINDLVDAISTPQVLRVQVPVKISSVSKGENEYGVKELIGSGETTYFHSAVNRVFNVNLAATKVTGILVAPEEIFSFANAVGEVSASTGYKQGYIIYNNKTILGDGGGLCQVSTTLFRAILDAGLPVVTRTGHAYRVSYYEQNSDPGFDATVFVPSVDLKFKNDTGNYLLIISESKPEEFYLKYSIYGTSDGRKVTITKPVITSVSKPPDTVYQDDPTLPKGTTKQIEWATWGAKVEFSRTVERGGKVIYQDLFKTNYSPWANAFLIGTKE